MTEIFQNATMRMATAIDRRRFIRRAAGATFAGVASLAAGRLISPSRALAYSQTCEGTVGAGCPYGCGCSPCCGSLNGTCDCGDGNGGCKDDGVHCMGKVGGSDWGGSSCWTCTHNVCQKGVLYSVSTTCCNCRTNSGCSGAHCPNGTLPAICIAWRSVSTYNGRCVSDSPEPPTPPPGPIGTVVGVSTGYPATSWGWQPPLSP
jgi:hypothetical protein